jgi:hypothetical protein
MSDLFADTKDWTWVLDRRCPECGFDTRTVEGPGVPGLIPDVVRAWSEVLAAPSPAVRPVPDRWSPLEYGCHVRDVFRVGQFRVRLMVGEDDPLFANWDQDATARAEGYEGQDPRRVADELRDAADAFARLLDAVPSDAWHRPGRRSDGRGFTVETFARYLAHDTIHHLVDVGVSPSS